jgi:hypothetical protein
MSHLHSSYLTDAFDPILRDKVIKKASIIIKRNMMRLII